MLTSQYDVSYNFGKKFAIQHDVSIILCFSLVFVFYSFFFLCFSVFFFFF